MSAGTQTDSAGSEGDGEELELAPMGDENPTLGWREWVALPDLGMQQVKAKVDTGARSSSLHAADIEYFDRDDGPWVRFTMHPWQCSDLDRFAAEAPLHEVREVRSSSGETSSRAVIETTVRIGDSVEIIELTLTDRSDMGFRMLLGREAIRGRYVVDSGRSYLTGRPSKAVRRRNRQESA